MNDWVKNYSQRPGSTPVSPTNHALDQVSVEHIDQASVQDLAQESNDDLAEESDDDLAQESDDDLAQESDDDLAQESDDDLAQESDDDLAQESGDDQDNDLDPELDELLQSELEAAYDQQHNAQAYLGSLVPTVDLATLLAEMTALKSEVRVETRSAREQRKLLEAAMEEIRTESQRNRAREQEARQNLQSVREGAQLATAKVLIGLVDRLDRSLKEAQRTSVERSSRRRFGRFGSPMNDPQLQALVQGLEMLRQSFDEQLSACQVERIETVGQNFDPSCMEALRSESRSGVGAGKVLAETTAGFRHGGRVLRPAQVIVNSNTSSKEQSK